MPFHEAPKDGGGSGKLCVAHGAHTEESGNRDADTDVSGLAARASNDAGEQWNTAFGGGGTRPLSGQGERGGCFTDRIIRQRMGRWTMGRVRSGGAAFRHGETPDILVSGSGIDLVLSYVGGAGVLRRVVPHDCLRLVAVSTRSLKLEGLRSGRPCACCTAG